MREIEKYFAAEWHQRRVRDINNLNKAGFIDNNSVVVNPIKLNLSPETLKRINEQQNITTVIKKGNNK
jgi:hypothetical protein